MRKNFQLFLSTSFTLANSLVYSVANNESKDSTHSHDFQSLAVRYHLDKFDGIYPINKNWLITKKFSPSIKKKFYKKILNEKIQIPLFSAISDKKPTNFTISEYIEHESLDIALIKVKEDIPNTYIQMIPSSSSFNQNSWVLISGKNSIPEIDQDVLYLSNSEQKTFAAFSQLSKKNPKQGTLQLTLGTEDDFYQWAYPYYQERQKNKTLRNVSPTIPEITEDIQARIKFSFRLDKNFIGVAESSDNGGVFLITQTTATQQSTFSDQCKLNLIGLIVPSSNHPCSTARAIDLTCPHIQEWIEGAILEYEANSYGIDDNKNYNKTTINIDESDTYTCSKNVKRSQSINILKPRVAWDGYIQNGY